MISPRWTSGRLEELQDAIQQALESGQLFDDQHLEEMMDELRQMSPEQMQQLVDRLAEKLADDNYVSIGEPGSREQSTSDTPSGGVGQDQSNKSVRFELTDKGVDFLGYKTLKDLLGSLGKASLGSHDTREMATGVRDFRVDQAL